MSFQKDPTVILLKEFDTPKQAKEQMSQVYLQIFEEELEAWCTNPDYWPAGRTQELFYKWFDVQFYSDVLDPYDNPIEKED